VAPRSRSSLYRIGEAAAHTALPPRAIRYYQEIGLVQPAAHEAGANRRFDADDVERLRQIRRLRETVGLSLADVQAFLETESLRGALRQAFFAAARPAERVAVLDEAEPVLRRRVALVESKLAAVQALLDEERGLLDRLSALRREHSHTPTPVPGASSTP
jgi:DNA-binding transcriptional MerR regulator